MALKLVGLHMRAVSVGYARIAFGVLDESPPFSQSLSYNISNSLIATLVLFVLGGVLLLGKPLFIFVAAGMVMSLWSLAQGRRLRCVGVTSPSLSGV